MKIILTEEEVKKVAVAYLQHSGQLPKEGSYDVQINTYNKDFLKIEAIKIENVKPSEEN